MIPQRWLWSCFVAAATVLGTAAEARAHLVSTELGPFYDGMAHAFVSPQDLLTILGFAILGTYAGPKVGRLLLMVLSTSWFIASFAGFTAAKGPYEFSIATGCVILLLGIVAVLKLRLRTTPLLLMAVAVGLARGVMNGSAARAADGTWLSVLGIATGVFVLCALTEGLGSWLDKRRATLLLRIAGSWIAAIGLLILGWELRG